MATGSQISVAEYLSTVYRPDCDYVDGEVVERNVGEYDHGRLQMAVSGWFYLRRKELGLHVVPELRLQVAPRRYRIPDVCVILGPEPTEQVPTSPPFICIEILSPDDRMAGMQERIDDLLRFGVPYLWLIDPRTRKAWRCTAEGMLEVKELRTETPAITVPVAELFE